jgi:cell wall-associated NlpC family hydrolase
MCLHPNPHSDVLFFNKINTRMNELEKRTEIIEVAKSWIGTPFHDKSAIKGVGVDCAMFLCEVFKETGFVEKSYKPIDYSSQWARNHNEELFLETVLELGAVEIHTPAQMGDIILFKHGRTFSHGAIIVNDTFIIHAYQVDKVVTMTERFNTTLCKYKNGQPRQMKYFSVFVEA